MRIWLLYHSLRTTDRARLFYLFALMLFIFLFTFITRTTYSAGGHRTHFPYSGASACARGAPLYATLTYLFTTVTSLSTLYIYGRRVQSTCTRSTKKSPRATTFPLSLVVSFPPVHPYPVCLLVFPLRARPGDGIAWQIQCAFALRGLGAIQVTDLRPFGIPLSPSPSASEPALPCSLH